MVLERSTVHEGKAWECWVVFISKVKVFQLLEHLRTAHILPEPLDIVVNPLGKIRKLKATVYSSHWYFKEW